MPRAVSNEEMTQLTQEQYEKPHQWIILAFMIKTPIYSSGISLTAQVVAES